VLSLPPLSWVETHVRSHQEEPSAAASALSAAESAPTAAPEETGSKKEAAAGPGSAGGKAKLIGAEERDVGAVDWAVYRTYFAAVGTVLVILIVCGFVADQATKIGADWWLSHWSDAVAAQQQQQQQEEQAGGNATASSSSDTRFYLSVYVGWGLANAFFTLARSLTLAIGAIEAARYFHSRMLSRVLRAPMSFFDTTPLGRVINRFSKDQYSIDETVPRTLGMFLAMLLSVVGTVLVISMVTPFFLVPALPLAWLYRRVQSYYLASTRELQRLDSITKSPIFSHFSETLAGAQTIRAYRLEERFRAENARRLDHNQKAYFCVNVANRWLGVRLESIGTTVVFFASLFVVLEREHLDPGLAGLSIAYALSFTGTLNWLVRMSTEMETQLVAVERVAQYTRLETEAPAIIPDHRPPADWPHEGQIEFRDLQLRYRPGLDLVLRVRTRLFCLPLDENHHSAHTHTHKCPDIHAHVPALAHTCTTLTVSRAKHFKKAPRSFF
jgi:ATP-binding cassette subfamily C (CFTR/MRP) protein 1